METWDRTTETGMASQAIEEDKMLRKKDKAQDKHGGYSS
jgi:hypothetical protein